MTEPNSSLSSLGAAGSKHVQITPLSPQIRHRGLQAAHTSRPVPPSWWPTIRQVGVGALDLIIVAAVIVVLRRSWNKNAGIVPLERLAFFLLPVFLIIMGLAMLESERPDAFIASLGVVVGLFTLFLMARQITLAQNLEAIARHQTDILDRQDAMLRQRAHLVVWGDFEYQRNLHPGKQTHLGFGIVNVGDRTAHSATLQLLMPNSFDAAAMFGQAYPSWFRTPEHEGFSRWETDLSRLFFIDVPVVRAAFVAFNHPENIEDAISAIKWRIAFADGVVPGKGLWQQLTSKDAILNALEAGIGANAKCPESPSDVA